MRIHLIGNAHLDPVWLWRRAEGMAEVRATTQAVLDLMEEYPELRFTCAGAYAYDWLEQIVPELLAQVRRHIGEGRWCVTGGWWIQADCNIPGGESFVRQGMYGQRWFQEHLGVRCRCGYCVDSFGHCASLPKILRGCGLEGWVWMRPGEHENPDIPKPYFLWQSRDGSRVLSLRISDQAYSCWTADDLEARIRTLARLYADSPFAEAVMCFYGVGDHGGGPTREQLERLRALAEDDSLPTLRQSSPEEVLDVLKRSPGTLPVYEGELQHHASGCYAAVSLIKQLNRRAETALTLGEAWAALSRCVVGAAGGDVNLEDAWRQLLFNQFHDILAGTSIPEAYEEAREQIGGVLERARWVRDVTRQRLVHRIDTRGEGRPILVFNNTARPFHGLVETEDFAFFQDASWRFTDPGTGRTIPHQFLRPHSVTRGRRRALLLLDLPAFGVKLLRAQPSAPDAASGGAVAPAPPPATARAGKRWIENRFLRLRVRDDGSITIRDKATNRLLCNAPSGRTLVIDDPSDTWSHGVWRYDAHTAEFRLRNVQVIERGPLRARLRLEFTCEQSSLRLEYSLGCDDRWVRVDGILDWHYRRRIAKLLFHVPRADPRHAAEIPFEVIERPNSGNEEPMQRWVALSGGNGHLVVVNDSIYSYDVRDGLLRLTLVRSPLFAHHVPAEAPDDPDVPASDQGERSFSLFLLPCDDWRSAGVPALAELLHAPPEVLFEGTHGGDLPGTLSLLHVDDPGVQVAAVKCAEDGSGCIVRLVEMSGESRTVPVTFGPAARSVTVPLRPWQVRTVLIPWADEEPVRFVNLLEEPEAPAP